MQEFLDLPTGLTSAPVLRESLHLIAAMACGGTIGLFARWLYRRFSATVSDRDSFSATFPLLLLATVLVIFVIKSSLALSLGLVGALSIIRFRAAIKEPEELVYLFFCIAAGIALGAKYYQFALAGLLLFTTFVLILHRLRGRAAQQLLLTISGSQHELCGGDLARFTAEVAATVGRLRVQRLDIEGGQVHYRVAIHQRTDEVGQLIAALQARLPSCQLSYVDLKGLV